MLLAISSFPIWIPISDPGAESYTKIFYQYNSGEAVSFQTLSPLFKWYQSSHFLFFHFVYKIQLVMVYEARG